MAVNPPGCPPRFPTSDLLGEDANGIEIHPPQWFSAEDGLITVDALLGEFSPELHVAKDDLLECQRVLREALKRGIRWHLAVDF